MLGAERQNALKNPATALGRDIHRASTEGLLLENGPRRSRELTDALLQVTVHAVRPAQQLIEAAAVGRRPGWRGPV
jgi:hypothetical protein